MPAWLGSHQSTCAYHIALGVEICFAICTLPIRHVGSLQAPMHNVHGSFLRLAVAMAVCCSCPCCKTIRGHIGMLKSPCVMPAEHQDISVCRTMTILSLLSQGISYPKAAKVTPCKCNMVSYWGLQAFITAVFFIRDMQQVSCDCIGYHHTFIPHHHPAPAFTAPAINHIIHSPSASFTAPAVSSP